MSNNSTEVIITAPDVSGYLQTGEVTLTCELHGYQSSYSPPMWLNTRGSEITTSDKYTISSSDGVNTIVLEDGTTLPSVIVSLTIHSLTSADKGNYTCRGTRGESVIRLTIHEGTAPPTTAPSVTTMSTGRSMKSSSHNSTTTPPLAAVHHFFKWVQVAKHAYSHCTKLTDMLFKKKVG